MTIAMLALAGIPATAGFIGKFYLIDALVDGGYTWLGVVIVVGSMISLGYYLRVVAAMWMREAPRAERTGPRHAPRRRLLPAPRDSPSSPSGAAGARGRRGRARGGAARGRTARGRVRRGRSRGAATIFFGIVPQPLFDLVHQAGGALGLL